MEWNREIMQKPMWKEEISNREEKEKIARRMAEKVQDGSERDRPVRRCGAVIS